MLVNWEESGPGLRTFWTDPGVVLYWSLSVAFVGLNAVVLRCVTCSITYITGDLHIEQNVKTT
jgi:hypothetical protein